MIKVARWYSCLKTPPKEDGDYLVARFDADGKMSYACGIHYTTKYGWNTYDSSTGPSEFLSKHDKYDRACLWTVLTKESGKKKNGKT